MIIKRIITLIVFSLEKDEGPFLNWQSQMIITNQHQPAYHQNHQEDNHVLTRKGWGTGVAWTADLVRLPRHHLAINIYGTLLEMVTCAGLIIMMKDWRPCQRAAATDKATNKNQECQTSAEAGMKKMMAVDNVEVEAEDELNTLEQ